MLTLFYVLAFFIVFFGFAALIGSFCEGDSPPGMGGFGLFLIVVGVGVFTITFHADPECSKEEVIQSIPAEYIIQEFDKGLAIIVNGEAHRFSDFEKTEKIKKGEFLVLKQTYVKSEAKHIKRTAYKIFDFEGNQL